MKFRGSPSLALLLFIFSYGLSSCVSTSGTLSKSGIEKRRYTKGYHINLLKGKVGSNLKSAPTKYPAAEKKILPPRFTRGQNDKSGRQTLKKVRQFTKALLGLTDSVRCGDKIMFRSGDKALAKIISIGPKDITYKKCNNLNGPLYVVRKSGVLEIEYANGDKDVFSESNADEEEYYVQDEEPSYIDPAEFGDDKLALPALLLGIGSFIVPFVGIVSSILAIAFGSKALRRIKASDGQITGAGKARAGIILGVVYWVLLIVIVAFILVLFAAA